MKLWQILDDLIYSVYYEKDHRNYYDRGGGFEVLRWLVCLPLLLIWWVWGKVRD